MITAARTNSENNDFITLVQQLNEELSVVDGSDHSFYSQFNKIAMIKHVIVVYENDVAVACGGLKEFSPGTMEVKRMFTLPAQRGKGVASKVLQELESWAKEMGYQKCILETGKRMPDAVALYNKCGYHVIPNYGQYIGVDNSICFEKKL